MWMDTLIVAAAALFFLCMGVLVLTRPAGVVAPFGISLSGPDARLEVCAVYGGFGIAVAGLLGVAALDPAAHRGELLAVAVALLGDGRWPVARADTGSPRCQSDRFVAFPPFLTITAKRRCDTALRVDP